MKKSKQFLIKIHYEYYLSKVNDVKIIEMNFYQFFLGFL